MSSLQGQRDAQACPGGGSLTGHTVDGAKGPQHTHGPDGREAHVVPVQRVLHHAGGGGGDRGTGRLGGWGLGRALGSRLSTTFLQSTLPAEARGPGPCASLGYPWGPLPLMDHLHLSSRPPPPPHWPWGSVLLLSEAALTPPPAASHYCLHRIPAEFTSPSW